jgi:hypothetical protein
VRSAPAAACATKSTRVSNHRYAAINRHSLRDGLRLISRSPRGPGSFAPVALWIIPQSLAPASGRQDHTTSPSATSVARLAPLPRPPHPASTSVTIASRPSCEDGTVRTLRLIWVSEKAKYFCRKGWTGESRNDPSGKSLAKKAVATEGYPGYRFAHPSYACYPPDFQSPSPIMSARLFHLTPRALHTSGILAFR